MAIDLCRDELITFAEAAALLLRRRRGTKIAVSTLHRWSSSGVGGMKYTSLPALRRFSSILTDASAPKTPTATPIGRDAKDAGERLMELGF